MKTTLTIILALFFIGCESEIKQEEKAPVAAEVKVERNILHDTADKVSEISATVKDSEAVKATTETVEEITTTVTEAIEEVQTNIDTYQEGKALYASCAGCHGDSGEKQALGKSAVIKGWSVQELTTALNGYKDGTYGGPLKGMMKGQAAKLDEAQTKAISEYIASF